MILPNAEIVAVGSELLTPSKTDTNSLWLTDQLNLLGVEVVMKSIVGDDRERLSNCIRTAALRSQIVIITGGLGPTEDDVTRDAVAAALDRGQTFQQELLDVIAERFRKFRRSMAENNRRQAYLIDGAEALPNDRGTAPGQWLSTPGCALMLLPGPPRELTAMFETQCLPRLRRILPGTVIRTRFYRVAGMGESDLDQLIAPVYTLYANPATTILAAPGDIQVHLRARCETSAEAEALLEESGSQIEALLGDRIYSRNGETLEQVVGSLLGARSETLAVAESLTGGLLGERLTSVAGSSRYFLGGFLTYTDEAKTALLGVDPELLARNGAVSEFTAQAMAAGARARLGTDWGLSVTGYAGPGGGEKSHPVGTVFMALAGKNGCVTNHTFLPGDRSRIRNMTSTWALDGLRKVLIREN